MSQPRRQKTSPAPDGKFFPIRTIATLTGVNPITLRAWERRYGLIKPVRTPKGHRLYAREHIDLIHRVLTLLDKGMSISRVRHALEGRSAPASGKSDPWAPYRTRMIGAVVEFDELTLDETYNEALSLYPLEWVTRRLLVPLLVELGERWETTEGSVAEEHFFAFYLRNKLGARFHHRARLAAGPRFLGACVPGEQHEIGLMLFALAAHEAGLQAVLLGANTPLEGLPLAAKRAGVDAIVLAGAVDAAPEAWRESLAQLVAGVKVPVLVGGGVSVHQHDIIVAAGAIALGDDIAAGVRRLKESIGHQEKKS